MKKKIYAIGLIIVLAFRGAFCGELLAQGPINNPPEFQEKAIKSALKGAKNKSLEQQNDNIRWDNGLEPGEGDDTKKEDGPTFVNVSSCESVK